MIRIMGLGISGIYLFYRLKNAGFNVSGYDIKRSDYYIPCAYATNINSIKGYMSEIGIEFEQYMLSKADDVTFAGNNFLPVNLHGNGLCTFDKNRLENDALKNIKLDGTKPGTNDIIVDATGISRAYLGRTKNDKQYFTLEYLADRSDYNSFYFYFLPNARGYFWSFPLGNKYHTGIGSISREDLIIMRKYSKNRVISRNIRMKLTPDSIFTGNTVGIGESVGTVSPITGEGIVPSLKSAELLFQMINRYGNDFAENYKKNFLNKFGYYIKLNRLVNNLQEGKIKKMENITAIKDVKKSVNEFGIKFNIMPFIGHFK